MTTQRLFRGCAAGALLLAALPFAPRITGQQDAAPLRENTGPLRRAMLLLREGKTVEARNELKQRPGDAEVLYQIARSYLIEFYQQQDPQRRTLALSLAMEDLAAALQRNPDHIPALRAKAVIHARAELLYYDPNLAYQMASRAAKIEPNNNGFLINLSEWMSGEVRFSEESWHRVPHDPLLGLDRSIELLDQVIDNAMPYSQDESAALYLMGNALSRRGNFAAAISYYRHALVRNLNVDQKLAAYREMGARYYRMGDFAEASRNFYEALQIRLNSIDQWLFRVALDRLPGPPPALPQGFLFEVQEPAIDPASPALLA